MLASLSAENFGVSAFCGLLDSARDVLRFSAGGSVRVLLLEPGSLVVLNEPAPILGSLEPTSIVEISRRIRRGSTLIVYAVGGAMPALGAWAGIEQELADLLTGKEVRQTERLADLAVQGLQNRLPNALGSRDGALLILQRD